MDIHKECRNGGRLGCPKKHQSCLIKLQMRILVLFDLKTMPDFFIHKTSVVDDDVQIGEGTKIWHFTHLLSNTKIGNQCSFGQNCVVGPNVTIGNGVKVQNNISIYDGVVIEDDVLLGPSMVFSNVINPRSFIVR